MTARTDSKTLDSYSNAHGSKSQDILLFSCSVDSASCTNSQSRLPDMPSELQSMVAGIPETVSPEMAGRFEGIYKWTEDSPKL